MRVIAFIVFEVFSAAKIALLREVRLQRPEYVAIWRRRAPLKNFSLLAQAAALTYLWKTNERRRGLQLDAECGAVPPAD